MQDHFFEVEHAFSELDGFKIAAAITGYDADPNPTEDPTIGTLKLYIKSYGIYDDGSEGMLRFKEIKTKFC